MVVLSVADYNAAHVKLITRLREVGIYHDMNDRLPLARYKHYLKMLPLEAVFVEDLVKLIDECIVLRREGHEPGHKDDRYT